MVQSTPLVQTVSSLSLVFGLEWFVILEAAPLREARRLARLHRASHFVVSGEEAASVGLAQFSPSRRGQSFYSAAQLAAQRFTSGTVAMLVPLDGLDGARWWLLAVHEGAVIARTDQVYADMAGAYPTLEQLRLAYPALVVLENEDASSVLSDLINDASDSARLQRLSYFFRLRARRFWPAYAAAVLAAGMLAVNVQWRAQAAKTPPSITVSDAHAWAAAIHHAAARHWVHGVAGTRDILESLYVLPVMLAGWRLLKAECRALGREWQCAANYELAVHTASNDGLLAAARPGWEVSFTPLESARVAWTQAGLGMDAAHAALNDRHYSERQLFSRFQAIRPAMKAISIAAPAPMPVSVPNDEHGNARPRPAGLPEFRMRAVSLRLPLRSLSVLLPYCESAGWHSLVLTTEDVASPSLKDSRFTVALQGVLYEKDE